MDTRVIVDPDQIRVVGRHPSFVGRKYECAILVREFESLGGTSRVALVAGEPGIGKTRLLEWIGWYTREQGATVLRGGASQAEGMPPYLPLLEAIGQYVRTADINILREQTENVAASLSGIVPELVARLHDVPSGYPLPPEQARLRLFESVGSFLTAISVRAPLVLLLDDLQWSDASTFDLLCHVTRTQPAARLLIVGAYRDTEFEDNPALGAAIAEFSHQRCLTTVVLGPLALGDTAMLAADHLVGPIASDFSDMLHGQSEGNPFFAEELLRGWAEAGWLERRGTGWFMSNSTGQTLPSTIVGVVGTRVARLAPDVIDHLRIAAVVGRTFNLIHVATISEQDAEIVERYLLEACKARLVQYDGDGIYSFSHDKIRECLYNEASSVRLHRLHASIGQALERDVHGHGRRRFAALAYHFARSGDLERGLAYSLQAAEEALQHSAPEEALRHYQTARDLLDRSDPRYGEVLLHIGDAALLAGKEENALAAFEESQRVLVATGDPLKGARAAHGQGVARLRRDDYLQARIAFDTALALLESDIVPEKVRVLVDLAGLLAVSMGLQAEGEERAHEALQLTRRLGDIRLEAAASRVVGNLQVRGKKMGQGIQLLERALALAQAIDDPAEAAECCACLANAYYWSAEVQRSCEYTVMRGELARRCQQPYQLRHVYSWLAFLAATQGDWDSAESLLSQARPIVEDLASVEPVAFLHQIQGFLALQRANHQRAEQEFGQAVDIFRQQGSGTLIWYLGTLGLSQLSVGKRREAADSLIELEALVAACPQGILPTAPALACMVLMAVQMGEHDRAARYHSQLRAFSGQLHWFLIDTALAAFEASRGRESAATSYMDRAQRAARRAGMRTVLVESLWSGRVPGHASYVTPTLPAGLSRREVEVLVLVSRGMSNRTIARELHLSENTVAKHLTSIFNKTGSDNRAAAAAFATRHGLSP